MLGPNRTEPHEPQDATLRAVEVCHAPPVSKKLREDGREEGEVREEGNPRGRGPPTHPSGASSLYIVPDLVLAARVRGGR